MSPIKNLSDSIRLPRLAKIHLGVKKVSLKGVEYPTATDFFVFPDDLQVEVRQAYGTDKPSKVPILIPVEDEEIWASQYYRAYSQSRGLICKGDGETASQVQDVATKKLVMHDAAKTERNQVVCAGKECPIYIVKKCQEVMCLQVMLPDLPGLGVYQIDSGSVNSIRNINSDVAMVRSVIGHVSMVPLILSLEPQEVVNPETGKKQKVFCLHLRASGSLQELLFAAKQPLARFLVLPSPETGALDKSDIIPIDNDGNPDMDEPEQLENAPVMRQDDKDPLAAWTGTSRPAQTAKNAPIPVEMPNPPTQPVERPIAQAGTAAPAQSGRVEEPTEHSGRILPSRYEKMRTLAGVNWTKLTQEIQKRDKCFPSELSAERGEYYIVLLEKKSNKEAKA